MRLSPQTGHAGFAVIAGHTKNRDDFGALDFLPGNPVRIAPLTDDHNRNAMVKLRSHTVTKKTHKDK